MVKDPGVAIENRAISMRATNPGALACSTEASAERGRHDRRAVHNAEERTQREGMGGARRGRRRHRLLAQLDPREAGGDPRSARRVLATHDRDAGLERAPLVHRPARNDAPCASGAATGRVLRPESRRLLRRGDAQQRGQRRVDRLAVALPHRADRCVALPGVQRSARAGLRCPRVWWCRHRVVQRGAHR